jgi:hypothetical protein
LVYIPADDTELGITQIGAQAGTIQPMPAATSATNPTTLISGSTAAAWCNQGGNGNEIDIDFKLRN